MSFEVAWNTQWPTACKRSYPADSITRYGVKANAGNAFNGEVVTTLYNRPWAMTLGRWPCLFANGTAINGGLPQLGNLTQHLDQVRIDASKLPADFSGYAVIDWEEWTPWLDANAALYYNRSLALANGSLAAATAAWNASSLKFMVQTLEVAKQVRPLAKWGYFGVIGCTFDTATEACRPEFQRHNDALLPLWRAQTALYPELYASCPFHGAPAACDASAKLPLKLAARMQEARRVVSLLNQPDRLPIIAFTWAALYTAECAADGHQCPRMENPSDLHAEFELAHAAGASGLIVWGANSDVRHSPSDCDDFASYLRTTLGPVLQRITTHDANQAATRCVNASGFANASCFGFDPVDATKFLQAALDSAATTIRVDPPPQAGGVWTTQPLFVRRSGVTLLLAAPLLARRGFYHGGADTLLSFGRLGGSVPCDDSKVLAAAGGGSIRMWRADYDNASEYTHAEHRHGLQFIGCRNVEVDGLSIEETGGDGVYLRNVSGATLRRTRVRGGYRNGVSVISAQHLLLEDLEIDDVNGTSPRSGVDIEPNQPTDTLQNITLRRVAVSRVGGCGIEIKHAFAHNASDPVPVSILVDSCSVTGADRAGLAVAPVGPGAQGTIDVRNTSIRDVACAGVNADSKAVESAVLSLSNTSLVNTSVGCPPALAGYGTAPIALSVDHLGGIGRQRWREGQTFGNVRFGGGVTVGSASLRSPAGRPFLNASQVLPDTGPAGKVPPADPAIYQQVSGTVIVYAEDESACAAALGRTGAKVQARAVCRPR